MADGTPDVGLERLLKTFDERQRAQLYQSLWHALPCKETTQGVLAITPDELLVYDPHRPDAPADRTKFGDELGPLRSVQIEMHAGDAYVLIGATRGVYAARMAELGQPKSYAFAPASPLRTGVNAVTLAGDRVLATHSEAGLLSWPIDGGPMQSMLESETGGARTVRFVCHDEMGRIWLAVDDRILAVGAVAEEPVTYRGASSAVSALAVHASGVIAGTRAGDVWRWRLERPEDPVRVVRGAGRPIQGLCLVDTGGIGHLVYADGSAGLNTKVLDDSYVCRYESAGQTIGAALAGEDLLIGVNEPPDTLFLWLPHEPTQPTARIRAGRHTSQFLRDVARWVRPIPSNESANA
jgi:hypothetical protein